MTYSARRIVDIETPGEFVFLDTRHDSITDIYARGDGNAEYALDVSDRPSRWIEGAREYGPGAAVNETLRVGSRYVRLRVTAGSATPGHTADLLLASSGP